MNRRGQFTSIREALIALAWVAALAAVAEPAKGQAQDARNVAQVALPAVVLIIVQDANMQPLAQGSGFVVGSGLIATNFHVIAGARSGSVKFAGDDRLHNIAGVVAVDKRRDLVLLSVPDAPGPSLRLGNANLVAVGDRVYAAGNPMGLEGTISEGIVSGVRQVDGDTLFQITAPISPGSSGGPILNSSSQVIGVATAHLEGGQNLNFAIPSSYLSALLAQPQTLRRFADIAGERPPSLRTRFGQDVIKGVSIAVPRSDTFPYNSYCKVSYSIRNTLRTSIKNVTVITVFYAGDRLPINSVTKTWSGVILAGLAARQTQVLVDCGTLRLAAWKPLDAPDPRRVEFRVLGFELVP